LSDAEGGRRFLLLDAEGGRFFFSPNAFGGPRPQKIAATKTFNFIPPPRAGPINSTIRVRLWHTKVAIFSFFVTFKDSVLESFWMPFLPFWMFCFPDF